MEGLNGLSLFEQIAPFNEEINIVYTPDASVKKYSYEITKDGVSYFKEDVLKNAARNIKFSETGKYQIIITTYDNNNNSYIIQSGIYNVDVDSPIIVADDILTLELETIKNNTSEQLDTYLKKSNKIRIIDNDPNLKIESNINEINYQIPGEYDLVYTVTDTAGNVTIKNITLSVTETMDTSTSFLHYGIILIVLVALITFFRNRRSIMLESRISKYSVNPMEDTSLSLLDKIINWYHKLAINLGNYLSKSALLEKYATKYEKYLGLYNKIYKNSIDLIANKFLIGIVFIFITLLAKTIQYEQIIFYELVLIFTLGFFVPDVVYISTYKIYRKKLENDILQAITIMNNAFKSGRSIIQAVDLVSEELDGQVALEFQKMSLEMSYGLGLDVVFKRLSERIDLEEVKYLTASLSILNKTGGNIIKVFSSIEKTLFNKKKLRLELASLTSSSKIIAYMLFAIPFLFIIFIRIINPTYFDPLYQTDLGRILIGIMIVIYIGYVWCVRKIMKVRM